MKVSLDFSNMKGMDLVVFCRAVYKGMKGHPEFPKTPVDLEVFIAIVEKYAAAITAADDGSRKAISARNKLREEVIKMVRQLGYYVGDVSEDLATLYSSSFEPAYKYRRLSAPLPTPGIGKINHGPNSGTLRVWITPISRTHGRVKFYELRHAEITDGVVTGDWVVQTSITARFPISVTGLKRGAVYAFQARATNLAGVTDWSDSATFMCT